MSQEIGEKTPLFDEHVAAGAQMVNFAGWQMPVRYSSLMEEHHQVRRDAGAFDVSHMCSVDITGPDARAFLRVLLACDIDRVSTAGKAIYGCMLNADGKVIDDLITYFFSDDFFRCVVNAGCREKDLSWIRSQAASFHVDIRERTDLAMIAVQGPSARDKAAVLWTEDEQQTIAELKRFNAQCIRPDYMVARTGYTGEDGYEIVLPATEAVDTWRALIGAGVQPIGLGARDTLRLEAGMNLYGNDMDESVGPLESGLSWTVHCKNTERQFIGRTALEAQKKAGVSQKLVGLLLLDKGVLRHDYPVSTNAGDGIITSGGFAPTLEQSIALARVPADAEGTCTVSVRKRSLNARIVPYPFVRDGKACND